MTPTIDEPDVEFDPQATPTGADPFGIRATRGQLTSLDTLDAGTIRRRGDARRHRKRVAALAGAAAFVVIAGATVLNLTASKTDRNPDVAVPAKTTAPTPSPTTRPSTPSPTPTSATPTPEPTQETPAPSPDRPTGPPPATASSTPRATGTAGSGVPEPVGPGNLPGPGEVWLNKPGDMTLDETLPARLEYLGCDGMSASALPTPAARNAVIFRPTDGNGGGEISARVYSWQKASDARTAFDTQLGILQSCKGTGSGTMSAQTTINSARIPVTASGVTAYNVTVVIRTDDTSQTATISDYLLLHQAGRYMLVDLTSDGHMDWNCTPNGGGDAPQCSLPTQANALATMLER